MATAEQIAKMTDPAKRAAAAAARLKRLADKREPLMNARDDAAMSLSVWEGLSAKEVWDDRMGMTRTAWNKARERVKARHGIDMTVAVTYGLTEYVVNQFGTPPRVKNAERVLARKIEQIAAIDAEVKEITALRHAAWREMLDAGASNSDLATAGDVSTAYISREFGKIVPDAKKATAKRAGKKAAA